MCPPTISSVLRTKPMTTQRYCSGAFWILLVAGMSMLISGCKSSIATTPPPGVTASGGILNNPQATPAAKQQAMQEQQMGRSQQMLMQQAHPIQPPTSK